MSTTVEQVEMAVDTAIDNSVDTAVDTTREAIPSGRLRPATSARSWGFSPILPELGKASDSI